MISSYHDYQKFFDNFYYFSNIDLNKYLDTFYGKIGYAFIDFKGNFLWADEYSKEVLFETQEIEKINLFQIMTDFSQYRLKKMYKEKFFDFKDEKCRIRIFTYSICQENINEKEICKEKCLKKLFELLNSTKTLVSRASSVLLQNFGESNACILLETKFSPYRQNFDYYHWKSYID